MDQMCTALPRATGRDLDHGQLQILEHIRLEMPMFFQGSCWWQVLRIKLP